MLHNSIDIEDHLIDASVSSTCTCNYYYYSSLDGLIVSLRVDLVLSSQCRCRLYGNARWLDINLCAAYYSLVAAALHRLIYQELLSANRETPLVLHLSHQRFSSLFLGLIVTRPLQRRVQLEQGRHQFRSSDIKFCTLPRPVQYVVR